MKTYITHTNKTINNKIVDIIHSITALSVYFYDNLEVRSTVDVGMAIGALNQIDDFLNKL